MGCVDLVIVGAGPAGLSAAIAAKRAGMAMRVFEKGVLVNSLFHFPSQMVFFTTPELLENWRSTVYDAPRKTHT